METANHRALPRRSPARGNHKGDPVFIFRTNRKEKARSYECCWGMLQIADELTLIVILQFSCNGPKTLTIHWC